MRAIHFIGVNRVYVAPKGWDEGKHGECHDLFVAQADEDGLKLCTSVWKPTQQELEILNEGGSIVLQIVGGQPPIMLSAQNITETEPERARVPTDLVK